MERFVVIFFVILSTAVAEVEHLWHYERFENQIKNQFVASNASIKCIAEFRELIVNNRKSFLDLFDATSKFPWSGIFTSSKMDYGNYDQCVNINHVYHGGKIRGKYCLAGLPLAFDKNDIYLLALCMPSGCTAADYNSVFHLPFNDKICNVKEDFNNFTKGDLAMMATLSLIVVIMVISTIYDVYLYKKQKKTTHPLYIAFSVFTNGKKVFQTSKGNREQIQIFNGMKTISMMWIIAGHAIIFWRNIPVLNNDPTNTYQMLNTKGFYVGDALLAVDSFFFMSGFLLAYSYMKQKNMPMFLQVKMIPSLIIHRYFRLTPALAMLFFFYVTLFKYTVSGPIVHEFLNGAESEDKACHQNWLPFFFYYQNYYNDDNLCLGHTWYLSVDMQMFVISPIILIPMAVLLAKSKKKIVVGLLIILNIILTIMPIILTVKIKKSDKFDHQTHLRLIDYTMGITMGIFMRESKDKPFLNDKIKKKSLANLLIWITIMFVMAVTGYEFQKLNHLIFDGSETTMSIIHSLLRPVWCLCLSWMVYSTYHGYGGIINWILTRPTFQITSKLSYCMYLMHWIVLLWYLLIIRTRVWYHDFIAFINWCGFFILTFIMAMIWSLSFEGPMITLEKIIFGTGPKRNRKKKHAEVVNVGQQKEK